MTSRLQRAFRRIRLGLISATLLSATACASAPRPRGENPHAERIQDSRPERVAAQRAGAPAELELQQSDERWGIEAARERREAEKQKKAAPPAPPAATKATVAPIPPP